MGQQRMQGTSDIGEFLLIFLKTAGLSGFPPFWLSSFPCCYYKFSSLLQFFSLLAFLGPCALCQVSPGVVQMGSQGFSVQQPGQAKPISAVLLISGVKPQTAPVFTCQHVQPCKHPK